MVTFTIQFGERNNNDSNKKYTVYYTAYAYICMAVILGFGEEVGISEFKYVSYK